MSSSELLMIGVGLVMQVVVEFLWFIRRKNVKLFDVTIFL
jgi:hypothetical protein